MAIQYDYGDQYPPDPPEDEWGPLEEDGNEDDPLASLHQVFIPASQKLAEDIQAIKKAFEPIQHAVTKAQSLDDHRREAAIAAAARRRDERARHWNG